MSDSAFKSAPFVGYTTDELQRKIADKQFSDLTRAKMQTELDRRAAVANGDYSQATDGERLRAVRAGKL